MQESRKYFDIFHDRADIAHEFKVPEAELPSDEQILFAGYSYENYSGSAVVLFYNNDGKLCEVNGGHCSCYGLEGQWTPEETSWEAIAMRPRDKESPYYEADEETKKAFWDLVDSKLEKRAPADGR